MNRTFRAAIFCVAVLCCAGPAYAATCAPAKLVHIVTVNVTPGVPAGSFNAQPRGFVSDRGTASCGWRALDSVNGIHEVIVITEPNIWMANLYDHTGKHIVDPGPEVDAKAPIFFGAPGLSPKLIDLEFGCEADFIAANAPAPIRSEQIGSARFDVYRVDVGPDAVEILEQPGTGRPAFARYYQKGKLVLAIRYDLYSTGLANDPNLFAPPSNVRYAEAGNSN